MHFEMPFKMHKIIFFSRKKNEKKCVPNLPQISRPVTQNTPILLFGLGYLYLIQMYRLFHDLLNSSNDSDHVVHILDGDTLAVLLSLL